jgi:hypothetical protein
VNIFQLFAFLDRKEVVEEKPRMFFFVFVWEHH